MEAYQDFLDRIGAFEKKEISFEDAYFTVSDSLFQKVDKNNQLRPFYGDTIVFNLDDATKEKIARIVDKLYDIASECFCERLLPHTFHMTLHDLSNSPVLENVAIQVFENELKVVKQLNKLHHQKIKMRSKAIFNMASNSLVMGLYPVDEEEWKKLMGLYILFDDVKKLEYPFTPHITLAYYHSNGFDAASARKLEGVVRELNETEMEIELDTQELFYQKFINMNEYINIINLAGNTNN